MEVDIEKPFEESEGVISAKDALIILQSKLRDDVKIGTVNVKGNITFLSEVFRVKKDKFYALILDGFLKIIIMKKELIDLQKVLVPGYNFIFLNLKPATLKKGVESPFKVYIPCSKTSIQKDDGIFKTLTLNDWCRGHNIEIDYNFNTTLISNSTDQLKFVSYRGVIEAILSVEFGIYNLDGNIILYTSHLPSVGRGRCMNVGTKIVVHNVHHGGRKEFPRICLYCCSKSTIKIIDESSAVNISLNSQDEGKAWVHYMVNTYNLCKPEIESLKRLYETVSIICSMFPREKCNVTKVLQKLFTLCYPSLENEPRNVVEEFFSEPHCCFFNKVADGNRIPLVLSVERLIELVYDEAADFDKLKEKYKDSNLIGKDLSEQLYWNYFVQTSKEKQIIIGYLKLCKTTGRLQLLDNKSKIDVVISNHNQADHHSSSKHCFNLEPNVCPFVQTEHLNRLMVITSYTLVNERFLTGHFTNIESVCRENINEFQYFTYLMFSMRDCKFLDQKSDQNVLSTEKLPVEVSTHSECQTEKQTLSHFDLSSNMLSEVETRKQKAVEKTSSDSGNSWIVCITHKESLITETKNKEIRLCFSALGFIVHSPPSVPASVCVNNNKPLHQPVHLTFQGESVKWYDILKSRCTYEVNNLDFNVSYNVPKNLQSSVKSSIQRCHTRSSVLVPANASFKRVIVEDITEVERDGLLSIEEIQTNDCKESLVSFVGVITNRKHCDSLVPPKGVGFNEKKLKPETQRQLGVSMLGNQCVQLHLKSLESAADIVVYLKLERTSYLLGLLPGTVVEFQRLERKVSKWNIVYCQYTMVSSHHILSINPMNSFGTSEEVHGKQQYLLEAINNKETLLFTCRCLIYQIISIRLQCVCCVCGSGFSQSKCINTFCKSLSAKLTGKISFLIDDGSTVAKAFVVLDPGRAKQFFHFDDNEFDCLLEEIQDHGEVYISDVFGDQESDIATFLARLCNSKVVKRMWNLILKPFYKQDSHQLTVEKLEVRNIHKGDTIIETNCFPYFTLECYHFSCV